MGIMLGNQAVGDIERRLHITLTDEQREMLNDSRQEAVNDTPLGAGKWHCYDIPFMMVCDTIETATKMRDMFMAYDLTKGEAFQIGWER